MRSPSTRPTSRSCSLASTRVVPTALLAATVSSAGCVSGLLRPQQEALDTGRARWEAARVTSYTFRFERSCYCATPWVRPMRIQVRDGAVVEAVFADDGEPLPAEIEPPTIELLFDEVQSAIDREAHSIMASYDPVLGYPTDVSIDLIEEAVDEEMAFRVPSLEPAASQDRP